jgi:hypothetical protein
MSSKLHRLYYVHGGDSGPIGVAIEEAKRLMHFFPEGTSGLIGINGPVTNGVPNIAPARTVPIRIEAKALAELSPEVKSVVKEQVPCIVGIAGIEVAILVPPNGVARSAGSFSDLRGKVRYALARVGWDVE